MHLIRVNDLADPRLRDFTRLTDVALRRSLEAANGLYLAESTKVILRALAAGHSPRSILASEEWLDDLALALEEFPGVPVFLADPDVLSSLTGFHLHRGPIASMQRPEPTHPLDLLASTQTVVVLDGLSDHTNVGAIFRSVAALGAEAVLLSPTCADPLYRRAVRVSMGAVLEIPWARLPRWQDAGPLLRRHGFTIVGFGFGSDSVPLESFIQQPPDRVALVFGAEGPGLSRQALGATDVLVNIPMDRGIDSLNVATAAGIALWAMRAHQRAPK